MRILIITDGIPYPPVSGGPLRVYSLLRQIARKHQIWLASLVRIPKEVEGVAHLREFCCGVEIADRQRYHPLIQLPGLLRYALQGIPLELKFWYSEALVKKIKQLVSEVDFDIVQIEFSHMARYIEALPISFRRKCALILHDLQFEKYNRMIHIERGLNRQARTWLYAWMMRRWEPFYAEQFGRCIVMSEIDQHLLKTVNPRLRVDVVPNGVDTQAYQPLLLGNTKPSLLFIGNMSYSPCVDAVLFFCQEILPHIRKAVPDTEMWIVGPNPPPEVIDLGKDHVHVTGRVDDVVPYYNQSTVCVVPLRAGGGTRLKILEAMALGRPVVSTSLGCEGLDVVDGEHLLIADNSAEFAEQTIRLLTDTTLVQRITRNARELVMARYDWDVIAERLMKIYAEIAASG